VPPSKDTQEALVWQPYLCTTVLNEPDTSETAIGGYKGLWDLMTRRASTATDPAADLPSPDS
jgi:hypothetical protein